MQALTITFRYLKWWTFFSRLGCKIHLDFHLQRKVHSVWKFCPNNLFRWRATYFSTIDNTALCKDINLCISRGIIFEFKSLRNDKNSLTCCGVYIAYWLLFTIFPQLFSFISSLLGKSTYSRSISSTSGLCVNFLLVFHS